MIPLRTPATVLLVWCAFTWAPGAQNGAGPARPDAARAAPPIDTPHLSLRLSTSAPAAAPGDTVTLFTDVTPKPRMHVYAPEQKDYIPIALTLQRDDALRPAASRYPAPEKYFFAPLRETQLVYSKPFRIAQDVTIRSTPRTGPAPAATHTISGTLRYQACDDTICYMPKNVPVSWTVSITGARTPR